MAVVSGEPPDDVAGGEVRSAGGLNLPLVPHRCQKRFCWNGWDETCGNCVEGDEALLSPAGVCFLGDGADVFRPRQIFGEMNSKVGD